MMGWLIAIAVLGLIVAFPLGLKGVYDQEGLTVCVKIGPFSKMLYPTSESAEKSIKSEKKTTGPAKEQEKNGGLLSEFLPNLEVALDFFGELRRKIRVKRLELQLVMAGDDPCDLAIHYGQAWAAVGNIMPVLEQLFVIKKRDVNVLCDFVNTRTTVFVRLDITITLGRFLGLLARYGLRALRATTKNTEINKGGAVK